MEMFKHALGDRVRDRVTGVEGVITSRAEHLFGCARYWVQPQEPKDGKATEGSWADEDALVVVQAGVIRPRTYRVVDVIPATAAPVARAGGPDDRPNSAPQQRGK